jgi:excinuclease ABC subunit C
VIDGGKGQLSSAIKGMVKAGVRPLGATVEFDENIPERASVPVCSLAKEEEEVFVPGRSSPVNDTPDSPALLLLRSLRNESHRFAIKSHRARRSIKNST